MSHFSAKWVVSGSIIWWNEASFFLVVEW